MRNKIIIAGAGPGAPDLITVRALKALQEADVIIYAGSLVNPTLLDNAKDGAEKINSASLNLDEVIAIAKKAVGENKKVLRLHTGDPSIYGAITEQMNELDKLGIEYEIIPGVSSALASAAALQFEMTEPGVTQSIIFTRREGRTPVPEAESLVKLAANNATLAIFLSIADIENIVGDLLAAGRPPDTPAAVVYRASWPNQKIVRGSISDIAQKVKKAGITRQAMIIIGKTLNKGGGKSLLYAETFDHGYRSGLTKAFGGSVALYAVTERGSHKAAEISGGLEKAKLFLPSRFSEKFKHAEFFETESLKELIKNNWGKFDAHVFVMASGIVVRKIAPLLKSKLTDPAVVVCDENGNNCISLLSGHIGGANRLAEIIAGITGGKAVITTASDVNGLMAFDELAAVNTWEISNPALIKTLNSMLLENKKVALCIPPEIFEKYYKAHNNLFLVKDVSEINSEAAVLLDCETNKNIPALLLKSCGFVLGLGCRAGTSCGEIEKAVLESLKKASVRISNVKAIASFEAKRNEPGLLKFAEKYNLKTEFYSAEELNSVKCPHQSPKAREKFGVNAVAEAAAMLFAKTEKLVLEKQKFPRVTVALSKIKG